MAKAHINIRKVSHASQLSVKQQHNNRTNPREDFSHIDPTKTYLNHDLVNHSNADLRDLVEERIQNVSLQVGKNIKKRKDAVIAYSIYLSYTHRAEQANGFSVSEWEEASLQWLQRYFGEENVVSAMVHLDESNPHIHAIVVPITPDLRLCAKDFTGTRRQMMELHQSYGRDMSRPPFCMELAKEHVKAQHASVQLFYDEMNAIDELEIPTKEKEESLEAYVSRVTEFCKRSERRHLAQEKHLQMQITHLMADIRGMRIEYKQAINLYQYLYRILGTKENADAELLNLYNIEHYPREVLERLTSMFHRDYRIDGNLVMQRGKANQIRNEEQN